MELSTHLQLCIVPFNPWICVMSFKKSRDPASRVCLASRIPFERDQTPDSGVASQYGGSLYISVKLADPSHILRRGGNRWEQSSPRQGAGMLSCGGLPHQGNCADAHRPGA